MYSRRIATFLLGAWIGASVLMAFVEIQNIHSPDLVLANPIAPAARIIEMLGTEQTQLLLRHLAAEQTRDYSYLWEEFQFVLALALGACLFLGTKKRVLPLLLCGVMLALVVFQHIAATPELSYRGRETDFPPGNTALAPMARVWALQQMYAGVEIVKLIAGGVLASYLFAYRTPQRRRSTANAIESPDELIRRRRAL
jgi:hypothetical protein